VADRLVESVRATRGVLVLALLWFAVIATLLLAFAARPPLSL